MNFPSSTINISTPSILDIPPGWGDTREEFREQVLLIIKLCYLWMKAPKYDIKNPDGSITPFYPILCAVSPEWELITEKEVYNIVKQKFMDKVKSAYVSATITHADHISTEEYLAWWLEYNKFTSQEICAIRFDHGDTVESYIKEYRRPKLMENTIEKAVDKLIYPRSQVPVIVEKTSGYVDDCCGCCH